MSKILEADLDHVIIAQPAKVAQWSGLRQRRGSSPASPAARRGEDRRGMSIGLYKILIWQGSSVVELRTHKPSVVGSNPTPATI